MAAVLVAFAATALVVPVLTSAWVADDWLYGRSVETLLRDHELRILHVSVATGLAHVLWGALFASVFDLTPGVLRLSTVVLLALGGLATYGLGRELRMGRRAAALAAALFLFNPLAYVLGFSFMTDVPFTTVLVVATLLYVRGAARGSARCTVGGSVMAAVAFLIRQQGVLIPIAVITWLVLSRRLRPDRAGLRLLGQVAAVPALTCAGYLVWLTVFHGVPAAQQNLFYEMGHAGWTGTLRTAAEVTYVEAAYLGLFVLPVSVVAVLGARSLVAGGSRRAWMLSSLWAALVVLGLVVFTARGLFMPYVPQFLASWGLGPADIRGGRPPVVGEPVQPWLTAAAAASAVVFGCALALRFHRREHRGGTAGLVMAVAAWQAVGVVPPSLHYGVELPAAINAITLDRYLLPLLPLAACLGLWAVAEARAPGGLWPAWALTAVLGAVAVAGTRDYLVFQESVDDLATRINRSGLAETRLDAGAQWTGARLHVDSPEVPLPRSGRSWWVNFFAPTVDAEYMIATRRIRGWDVVDKVPYSSWLSPAPRYLVVLRRSSTPSPAPAR